MESILSVVSAENLTLGAITAFFVIGILTGHLVPKRTMDATVGIYKAVAEKDAETIRKQQGQIGELLELAKTSAHLVESLPVVGDPHGTS